MNKRETKWQIVRGICIIAVILIHCPNALHGEVTEYNTWIITRQFIDFPVPVFIFLAGYFVNQAKVLDNAKKRLITRGGGTC